MLAKLHLAEEAFALHLFLQGPEGLIDIIVSDENLHAVFLSIRETRIRLWTVPIPMATVVRIRTTELAVANHHDLVGSGETNQRDSYPGERKMKIITTWHCMEILQGEGREATPREWLILVGPGEDLIFEVKTARQPTNKPNQQATRH
jgi:hypothetical protein